MALAALGACPTKNEVTMNSYHYGAIYFTKEELLGKNLYGLYELVALRVGFDPHDPTLAITTRLLTVSEDVFNMVKQAHLEEGASSEQFATIWLLDGPLVNYLFEGLVARVLPGYVGPDETALDIDPDEKEAV